MALTDEQRAMLQLLLEGGQGYDDIGSLLGIGPEEVRSRARDALREMGGSDPDAQVGLSDYLLGQADPIGRADAVRHLQNDPEANALADRLVTQMRLLAPKAQLPEIPAPRKGRAAPAAPPPAAPPGPPPDARGQTPPAQTPSAPAESRKPIGSRVRGAFSGFGSLSKRQSQALIGIGSAVVLIVVAVLATGVIGGGDGGDSDSDCEQVSAAAAQQAGVPAIQLEAASGAPSKDGCAPTGQAVFTQAGQGKKAQIVLQTNLANLVPTGTDQTYIVWLYNSDEVAVPLAQDVVGEDGNLSGAAPIPGQLLTALGSFASVRISLATTSEAQAAIAQAGQQQTLPGFLGQTVLEGPLPDTGQGGQQQGQGGAQQPQQGQGAGQGQGQGQGQGAETP